MLHPDIYTPAQLHAMGRIDPEDAATEDEAADLRGEAMGRRAFAAGGGLEAAHALPYVRGWVDGHREAYAAGVVAFLRWDADPNPNKGEVDNPFPQFSGAWEAWADGFEAEGHREPATPRFAAAPAASLADAMAPFVADDDDPYVKAARTLYHREGGIEIDDSPVLSQSSDGAYVSAWVWVSDEDAGIQADEAEEGADVE